MNMTDLLGGVLGNSGGLLEHLQGDQTRQGGLADLLNNLGAEQSKPDGNILDQLGGLINGKQPDDAPSDFMDFLNHVNGPAEGMAKSAGIGAIGTLAMSMLMGRNSSGFATKALKMGGIGALGGIAFKAFQNWQASQQGSGGNIQGLAALSPAVHELSGNDADARSQAILVAMISAAKADEHIDAAEETRLTRAIEQSGMDGNAQNFFLNELRQPLDAGRVAAHADDLETAAELYAATLLVVDEISPAEREYLAALKAKLGLPPELASALEQEVR